MNFVKKVVVTGPESTGKTTLALELSSYFQTALVSEYARKYIDELDRVYREEDLLMIAKGQLANEEKKIASANKLLICDTDLITIKIWSMVKYERCSPFILQEIAKRDYDLYLLCKPDIPWEPDPQREHPEQRDQLYDRYKKELEYYAKPFIELGGSKEKRLAEATLHISSIIQ